MTKRKDKTWDLIFRELHPQAEYNPASHSRGTDPVVEAGIDDVLLVDASDVQDSGRVAVTAVVIHYIGRGLRTTA